MPDILIRQNGQAGHITLNRPQALNALTWEMCLTIEKALDTWRTDPAITLIMIDGAGDRAFCSGGDIAEMYAAAQRGDLDYGRRFWRDEYRLNAKIHDYPKPIVTFLHGFTMGGGVGVGCHGSHRIVCENSQIAMPECSIGLVPDVGGSLLLALAPGRLGEYLGTTGARMGPSDAMLAGFADSYVVYEEWEDLKADIAKTADLWPIEDRESGGIGSGPLFAHQIEINRHFSGKTMDDIRQSLAASDFEFETKTAAALQKNAPLAMSIATEIIRKVRQTPTIKTALDHEFRYTYRCVAQGDFIEGIRAAIIDRDKQPKWQPVTEDQIAAMTAPLSEHALQWEDTT